MKGTRAGATAFGLILFTAVVGRAEINIPGNILSGAKSGSELVLGGPVALNADRLVYDEENGVALAEGNVEIGFGNRTIRADRIRYDSRSGEAELLGHVRYKEAGDDFSFDRIVMNLETQQGVLYNGSIHLSSNNYLISSEKFEKTGPRSFRLEKGSLTTCPCDPVPDWKFEVRRSRVTIDGYAVGRDVTFRIRDIPVLWLPWAAFPVKLSRQSGFLLPSLSHSGSKGYAVQLPFYWAISRWSDATITLEEMSARGLRPEVEYRYVLNPASEGEAHVTAHHDRITSDDRYRVYGQNTYRSDDRWTANAKWDLPSDKRYYLDLVDTDILRTGRHVPSRGFVGRTGGAVSGALSAVWVEGLQDVPDDNTVQRLPEITVTVLPTSIGRTGAEFASDMSATHFYRRGGNRELRGRGYGEISRTIHLHPSVTLTPFAILDVLQGYTTSGDAETRGSGRVLPAGGGHLESTVYRRFDQGGRGSLVHSILSAVSFQWIPVLAQDNIPVTDQWSRIRSQQQLTFSVTQRVLRVGKEGEPAEVAFLALEWALDMGGKRSSESPYIDPYSPFVRSLRDQIDLAAGRSLEKKSASSDIYARFRARPAAKWSIEGETLFDPYVGHLTTTALGVEWKQSMEKRVSLAYRMSRDLAEDLIGIVAVRPFRFLGFQTNLNYSIRNSQLTEGTATLTVYPRSDCWSVGFVGGHTTTPNENSYKILFSLKGMGSVGN